ncbi:MAG: stage III sporulation protein AA [Ruminococcus sp.]|nr:stage III sporulation protein AA [Ruminococcus sp.]
MNERLRLTYAADLLTDRIREALYYVSPSERESISELRLRRGRYFSAVLYGREYFPTPEGKLMNSPQNGIEVTPQDIETAYVSAFKGSVHAYPREQSEGYITTRGGNRIGFSGTAVVDKTSGDVTAVRKISSMNIRIAREVRDCARPIYDRAFAEGLSSLIVCSPPCGGKTTVLRDLSRLLGAEHRVSLIDERGELACSEEGVPQNDVGVHTDVFDCYPRRHAIVTAVRTMSPEIIICDEIGAKNDLDALEYALDSGVKLVCSCHAGTLDELKKRSAPARLIKDKVLSYAAFLGTGNSCGRLREFYKL